MLDGSRSPTGDEDLDQDISTQSEDDDDMDVDTEDIPNNFVPVPGIFHPSGNLLAPGHVGHHLHPASHSWGSGQRLGGTGNQPDSEQNVKLAADEMDAVDAGHRTFNHLLLMFVYCDFVFIIFAVVYVL